MNIAPGSFLFNFSQLKSKGCMNIRCCAAFDKSWISDVKNQLVALGGSYLENTETVKRKCVCLQRYTTLTLFNLFNKLILWLLYPWVLFCCSAADTWILNFWMCSEPQKLLEIMCFQWDDDTMISNKQKDIVVTYLSSLQMMSDAAGPNRQWIMLFANLECFCFIFGSRHL